MKRKQLSLNTVRGGSYDALCAVCDRETNHEILSSPTTYEHRGERAPSLEEAEEFKGDGDAIEVLVTERFVSICCNVCGALSLWRQTEYEECWTKDGQTLWDENGNPAIRLWQEHNDLFPPRMAGVKRMSASHLLPTKVRRIYEEALAAVLNRLPVCAVAAIRAVVDAMCLDKSAKGRDLYRKIEWLGSERVIADTVVLQKLRQVANWRLHEVEPPPEGELKLMLQIVEDVLTSVYITKRRAEGLPRRRAKEE